MGACIASALCCAGQCCCSCLCWPCRMASVQSQNYARIGYVFLQAINMGLSFLFIYLYGMFFSAGDKLQCPGSSTETMNIACTQTNSIVRMSFALAVFHLTTTLILLPKSQFSAIYHDAMWTFKFIFIWLLWLGMMFVNTQPFFQGYMQVARAISFLFLMY